MMAAFINWATIIFFIINLKLLAIIYSKEIFLKFCPDFHNQTRREVYTEMSVFQLLIYFNYRGGNCKTFWPTFVADLTFIAMKKIYLFLTALMLCIAAGAQTTIKGDVNGDGTVDIADVTEVVNIILNPDSDDDTPTGDPRAIDLGLSVKWASCNVGATAPEEYGGYYAWGETEEKSDYNWITYKHCNGSNETTMTKYCTDSSYGTVDNKTTLEQEDDVATVKWGGNWRIPTREELQELIDKCTWTWTTYNEVNG